VGLTYDLDPAAYRVGEAIAINAPSLASGEATAFVVDPPLPAGLALDPLTGAITGTPLAEARSAIYAITASNADGEATVALDLVVGPQLPPEIGTLAPGFAAVRWATGLALPSKIALAPDGRCFFPELKSGNVRVISADGTLDPAPWATVTVQGAGSHQGLLALALSPAFSSDGHLFVLYSAPPDATHPTDHMRLERFTDVSGVGTNQTVILDDLATATINNGSDLVFDLEGNLFVSLGDANVAANAQDPQVFPGKVLRITPDGLIPADNPDPQSAVFCLGLRNTFGLALHPTTGGLFGVDNGPAQDDELNYLAAGKNFGWGAQAPIAGSAAGLRIQVWQTEIVPTAVAWHTGVGFGTDYVDDLFLASYDDERVRRFEMSGGARTDVDFESDFLTFIPQMTDHKPLDLVVALDGALWVSTFTSIYRIHRLE
jgi:glucose/arabinose dehydrogenase